MATYLLTWNPAESSVADLLAAWRKQCEGKASPPENWSCGSNKSIPVGSRVFLHRQAVEPRGLVASGWVTRPSYRGKHWDPARARKGDEANYVDIRLDAVCDGFGDDREDSPVTIAPLPVHATKKAPIGTEVNWRNIPGSGIQIPDAAAREIERLWALHVSTQAVDEAQGEILSALEGDLKQQLVWSRTRESSLRKAKLRAALKQSPDGLLRCEVPGCGFCFESFYGEVGKGFAHVHHVNALAGREQAQVTTLDDLVIVCANCHAMIHRHGQCRPLKGLIANQ
jgi:5-methylcytosine-specific restriction protein A